eukprot:TRINITY_DN31990_c0_g1_i1.p1 TRINITY_DN31990_c0_g1~~TRINITY_DN31990_c0_g1_i1.p1  ORF type:complete len:639 (-),score=91.30 TRINITY_DN31990_c0_g1_i1:104-2020(-)
MTSAVATILDKLHLSPTCLPQNEMVLHFLLELLELVNKVPELRILVNDDAFLTRVRVLVEEPSLTEVIVLRSKIWERIDPSPYIQTTLDQDTFETTPSLVLRAFANHNRDLTPRGMQAYYLRHAFEALDLLSKSDHTQAEQLLIYLHLVRSSISKGKFMRLEWWFGKDVYINGKVDERALNEATLQCIHPGVAYVETYSAVQKDYLRQGFVLISEKQNEVGIDGVFAGTLRWDDGFTRPCTILAQVKHTSNVRNVIFGKMETATAKGSELYEGSLPLPVYFTLCKSHSKEEEEPYIFLTAEQWDHCTAPLGPRKAQQLSGMKESETTLMHKCVCVIDELGKLVENAAEFQRSFQAGSHEQAFSLACWGSSSFWDAQLEEYQAFPNLYKLAQRARQKCDEYGYVRQTMNALHTINEMGSYFAPLRRNANPKPGEFCRSYEYWKKHEQAACDIDKHELPDWKLYAKFPTEKERISAKKINDYFTTAPGFVRAAIESKSLKELAISSLKAYLCALGLGNKFTSRTRRAELIGLLMDWYTANDTDAHAEAMSALKELAGSGRSLALAQPGPHEEHQVTRCVAPLRAMNAVQEERDGCAHTHQPSRDAQRASDGSSPVLAANRVTTYETNQEENTPKRKTRHP